MGFGSSTSDIVLQGMFMGIIFAVLVIAYNKLVIGKFVKALIKAEAVHPNFAKSFEELNIKKNILFSYALRTRGFLRKFVYEPEEEERKGKFYIPEDKLYRAGRIYGGKDVDLLMVAATIIILLIFFAVVLMYMPVLWGHVSGIARNIGV